MRYRARSRMRSVIAAIVAIGAATVLLAIIVLDGALIPNEHRLVHANLGPADQGSSTESPARKPVALYDTAWFAPTYSSAAELDEYFAHLETAGFTGSLMNLTALSSVWPSRISTVTGKPTDFVDKDGFLHLDPDHVAYLRVLLDSARAHRQRVVFVPAWEQDAVCGGYAKKPAVLTVKNAYAFGAEIARAVGDHPAIDFWVFGGDAETGPDGKTCYADVEVWRQLSRGLKDNGAAQPIAYHTAKGGTDLAIQPRHIKWAREDWLDILAPQTGQCESADIAAAQLSAVAAFAHSIRKRIISIEMRYESVRGTSPSFCQGRPRISTADLRADAHAAVGAGVDGVGYGHHDRWQWGNASLDESVGVGGGFDAVRRSFFSPGEQAYLDEALHPSGQR